MRTLGFAPKMATNVVHVKLKSAWKRLELPKGDGFENILDFQELSDYEIVEDEDQRQPNIEQKKGKKRKKKRVVYVDSFEFDTKETHIQEKNEELLRTEKRKGPVVEDQFSQESELEPVSGESWKELGISSVLLRALQEEGFTDPTPIQALALPHAIQHKLDIIGAAETGSGKTLAFGLPILEQILRSEDCDDHWKKCPCAVILEPTRELALQVYKHLKSAARHTSIKIMAIVGGMAPQKQYRLLKRHPHVIVATPGRLWELIEEGQDYLQNLHNIKQFVLDEADRMIEKGHFQELDKIVSLLNLKRDVSTKRQHFILSATLTLDLSRILGPPKKRRKSDVKGVKQKLEELVQKLGIEARPKIIDLTRQEVTVKTLTETRIDCSRIEKDLYLYYFLRKNGRRTLVFCNSKDCVRRLVSIFTLLDCNPLPLHSDMHQRQRLKNLDHFAERTTSLLIATDVAARGLDIKCVDHVVHYQVPFTVENYIHRCGRTARASQEGLSVMLISPDEFKMYGNIVKLKQGHGLVSFPLDTMVLKSLKKHMDLAKSIDIEQHRLKKGELHNQWMQKAGKELDLELDEDLFEDNGEEQQRQKRGLKCKKQQLTALLKQTVIPSTFCGRFPTQSGPLVLPRTIPSSSAVC